MSEPFFITGLPRSRTAWWSVVTGAVHEPGDLNAPWRGGVSDSYRGKFLPALLEHTQTRTLIVIRPIWDVEKSLAAYIGDTMHVDWLWVHDMLTKLTLTFQDMADHPLVKTVTFDQCNDIEVVRACLAHLQVAEPANLEQLMNFRIVSDLGYNLKRLARAREVA